MARNLKGQTVPLKETAIVKQILDYLAYRPGKYWRQNIGATKLTHNGKTRFIRFGVPGAADISGVLRSRRMEIEVKRPGQKQTPDQKEYQRMIEEEGGLYLLAESVEDVMREGL